MGESRAPAGMPELLYYRPWRGTLRQPAFAIWPIARVSLNLMLRRKLFWGIYGLGLVIFAMFFFGQYLLAWAQGQMGEGDVDVGGFGKANPEVLMNLLRGLLKIDGTGESYKTFFLYQIFVVMIVLALAGSIIIGNDLLFGSLPFYLSKPLSRAHYLWGKGLAVGVFINLLTTLPALVLYVQYRILYPSDPARIDLFFGILGYGLVLTISLTLILLATATWLRRTVPLVMAWSTLFFFLRMLATGLVDGLHFHRRWRLIDLWNDAALVGNQFLSIDPRTLRGMHPPWQEATWVLGGVSLTCLIYLILRIRAVEIVR
jgi:ABC-type transport system involved in multi-copper enzyme maturation permease subunit